LERSYDDEVAPIAFEKASLFTAAVGDDLSHGIDSSPHCNGYQMIYSIQNDFIFIHCPRTSGTTVSRALQILVPDAVRDDLRKHDPWEALPQALKHLRSFTIFRRYTEVRTSYYHHIRKWLAESNDQTVATVWLLDHARRIESMTLPEYLVSDEPPINTDGYVHGVSKVFQYSENPYREIAEFCGVVPKTFEQLVATRIE
jgi:hypothetical protein